MQTHVTLGRFLWGVATAVILPILISWFSRSRPGPTMQNEPTTEFKHGTQSGLCRALATALPDAVFTSSHTVFRNTTSSYWSVQECEVVPQCVVKPRNATELSTAIRILRERFDEHQASHSAVESVRFAVKSGGHSPEAGFANVDGGILIDLGLINEVTVSQDEKSTVIGSGARWHDVSSKLDSRRLAVAGGRNSNVGVGGLILGGGISFYSPQVGLVCSNIISYEIVLADGTIAIASSAKNSDLWRALKGGTGNFGIVTRFTARTFPAEGVWGGYLYSSISKAPQYMKALYDFGEAQDYDEHAAGPIAAFGYVRKMRISAIGTTIMYTKLQKWPSCFDGFKAIRRLWSTAKVRTLTDATQELNLAAPVGKREFQVTTTIKNDLETMQASFDLYRESIDSIRGVSGITYSLVFQPLRPEVMIKGSVNALGLSSRKSTLVIVLMTTSWKSVEDDALVEKTVRSVISDIDVFAAARNTSDQYRYLNYAASGQDPFAGYGEENKRFLQDTSRHYDPQGFFQKANVGGFRLFQGVESA